MKITFAMIVLNGDFVLKQVLQSIYPYAHKIIISEGAVKYWTNKGVTTSTDKTNEILENFPDPDNKLKVIHGQYEEKTEQCRAFMEYVPSDTDYLWCIDSDEVFKDTDIRKMFNILQARQPSSVGFKSNTFFGGFSHTIGGFERNHSFKRVLKYQTNTIYDTHRPPTLKVNGNIPDGANIKGNELYERYGIEMYHYSYVSARQVKEKLDYYEDSVIKKGDCIPNYFTDVWRQWVLYRLTGSNEEMNELENIHKGVHEFKPSVRGYSYTVEFTGTHPKVIEDSMEELGNEFLRQFETVC
jgi:hypothetical protein